MKKLNKLQINSERIMNNDELITMRGGYDGCSCVCYNWNYQVVGVIGGEVTALTCNPLCLQSLGHGFGNWSC